MEIEVINYIKEAQKHNLTETEIKQNLLNAGWDAGVVEDSLAYFKAQERKPAANQDEDIHVAKAADPTAQVRHGAPAQAAQPSGTQDSLTAASLSKSQTGMTKQHFQNRFGALNFFRKPSLWIIAGAAAALGAGGFIYYTYAYNTPAKTWAKYAISKRNPIYKTKFQASFQDKNNNVEKKDNPLSGIKDIKITFDGNFYVDGTDSQNPQSSSNVKYSFSMGNTSLSTGFEYRLINKILYVNLGDNPFFNGALNALSPEQKIEWVSLDINKLQEELDKNQTASGRSKKFNEIFNPSFRDELQKIWEDSRFVKVEKYLGKENIGTEATFHFKNVLDKQAIKNTLSAYLEKIFKAFKDKGEKFEEKDLDAIKSVVNSLTDKLEIKELETWVGQKDFRLYKVRFVSNAPSVLSLINGGIGEVQSKSKDAKRLADIRQMASALELYYNDNGGYPDGKDGMPLNLTPTYIGIIPSAPAPPDGACTDYYNPYWYQPMGKKKTAAGKTFYGSYEVTFCLGASTGGYPAGIAKLTPQGIQGSIACPSTPENCAAQKPATAVTQGQTDEIKSIADKIPFTAELKVESEYSDYGKIQNQQAPEKFFDLLQILKGGVKGAFTDFRYLTK